MLILSQAMPRITMKLLFLSGRDLLLRRKPANIYLFKVDNRNTRKSCEICSKLTIKTPEPRQWRRSGVSIVDFEHISHLFLLFQLLKKRKKLKKTRLKCVELRYIIYCQANTFNHNELISRLFCKHYVFQVQNSKRFSFIFLFYIFF